jgi:K+-sensing histidine kinase KdpD
MNSLRRSLWVRYGLAVGLVALAEYLRTNLPAPWAAPHWAILFLPAVLLAAWFGGFGPGLVSTVASTVLVSGIVSRGKLSMQMLETMDLLLLVVFVVIALGISIVGGTERDAS